VLHCMSLLLALNGHAAEVAACPLSGVNRTLWVHRGIDAIDPKQTLHLAQTANPANRSMNQYAAMLPIG
jgi:hypothetical protein